MPSRHRASICAVCAALLVGSLAVARASEPLDPTCDAARPALAHRPSGADADASQSLIPCVYRTGRRAMEPSIGFTADGRVLFQAWELRSGLPGGVPPAPVLLRFDGGVWRDISPGGLGRHLTSLDPYLYVDPVTKRIFTLDWIASGVPFCSTLSFSDDNGDTWTTTPLACGGFDGESIGAGPPVSSQPTGYPNVVYYCTGASLGTGDPLTTPWCSKSLDGGLTFIPTLGVPYRLTGDEGVFPGWAGNPVVDPDGTVYLPKRHDAMPYVAISKDEGSTWTRVQVADNGAGGAAPRMAVRPDGSLAYAWIGGDHLPYIATSRDAGATWSPPVMIAAPGVEEAALARITVGPNGSLAVAYVGTEDSPGAPFYAYCNVLLADCADGIYEGVEWNGYLAFIEDGTAVDPVIRTATVNAPDSPLFVGGCSADGACKAVLDFVDVAFDAVGSPWAAFVDDCALTRDFPPIYSRSSPPCGDGVGEGIVLTLRAA